MNTLKKIFTVATAAAAIGAMAMTSIPASAATEIPYNGASEDAYKIDDDGSTLRVNILNTWGNNFVDIDANTVCNEYIEVEFTISGIGSESYNKNEDGSDGDHYQASLVGTIGANKFWGKSDDVGSVGTVEINGDGTYTVRSELSEAADTILCLILKVNVNVFNYSDTGNLDESGISVVVNSIRTGDDPAAGGDATDGGTDGSGETTTSTTSGDGSGSTTTTTTTKSGGTSNSNSNSNSSKTNSSSNSTSNSTTSTVSQTADAGVVAIVVGAAAAASLAVGAMTIKRKRK